MLLTSSSPKDFYLNHFCCWHGKKPPLHNYEVNHLTKKKLTKIGIINITWRNEINLPICIWLSPSPLLESTAWKINMKITLLWENPIITNQLSLSYTVAIFSRVIIKAYYYKSYKTNGIKIKAYHNMLLSCLNSALLSYTMQKLPSAQ